MYMFLMFVTEALAEEAAPGFTLAEIWYHSGWLARMVIVMLCLMLLGAIYVAIERSMHFRTARRQSMQLAAQALAPLQKRDIVGALKLSTHEDFKSSYLAALLTAGLKELDARLDPHGLANAQRAVNKAIHEEIGKMRRGMPILATTGSTAPFVGLFGTTFGVINAFQGMATEGSGLASISAGISEALITTGVGIGVAVVGVWFFNYFTNRIEKVEDELTSSEADFMDWAAKLLQERPAAAAK